MPIAEHSSYVAPLWLRNGHLQTMLGAFRPSPAAVYSRERIETPDGDFLDLDWVANPAGEAPSRRLVIISYGMESSPQSPYVRATVAALRAKDLDVLVWNYRGCSGEPNRKRHFYHGGLFADLEVVVHHAVRRGYPDIALAGFSLGGNLTLNYLGHRADELPPAVHRAIAFSTPMDVADCAVQMHRTVNRIYVRHFLRSFRKRIREKMAVMPGQISDREFRSIATIDDYDARYTVPHFGFTNTADMYRLVSSRNVVDRIRIPTLIICALDDPFMGPDCCPLEAVRANPNVTLERPPHGGHLGFLTADGASWIEHRVADYLSASSFSDTRAK